MYVPFYCVFLKILHFDISVYISKISNPFGYLKVYLRCWDGVADDADHYLILILILSVGTQCNFEQSNRFHPLVKELNKASSAPGINKSTSVNGLKFVSLNSNGTRGKKLEQVAFLNCHKSAIVAIQTKIDDSISTSELFPDSCPYNAYRKNRNLHGGAWSSSVTRKFPICHWQNWKTTQNMYGLRSANKTS